MLGCEARTRSFLTFEFGEPYLHVLEPKPNAKTGIYSKRRITVYGQWHLWIYCCHWDLDLNGTVMAHDELSPSEMKGGPERGRRTMSASC